MIENEGDDSNEPSFQKGLIKVNDSNLPHRKWMTLVLHASIMCGREFLYAVEIVLVTPIILQLGMPEKYYSFMWCFSPIVGVLVGPVLGSSSDHCTSRFGRRRPYIVGLVIGALIGLTFLIFSKDIAYKLGGSDSENRRVWGVVLGVIGAQLMDFCLDQTETPLRAFTMDVCSLKDQQRAFALQTVFVGIGGALGFVVDGIDWESTALSNVISSQIQVVYVFAVLAYLITTFCNLYSIKEVPISITNSTSRSSATIPTRAVTSQVPQMTKSKSLQVASLIDESTQTLYNDSKIHRPVSLQLPAGKNTPSILVSICENDDVYQARQGPDLTHNNTDCLFSHLDLRKFIYISNSCPGGLQTKIDDEKLPSSATDSSMQCNHQAAPNHADLSSSIHSCMQSKNTSCGKSLHDFIRLKELTNRNKPSIPYRFATKKKTKKIESIESEKTCQKPLLDRIKSEVDISFSKDTSTSNSMVSKTLVPNKNGIFTSTLSIPSQQNFTNGKIVNGDKPKTRKITEKEKNGEGLF